MSYNQIIKKKLLGTITKNGKQVKLSAALQTTQWTRPEFAADAMKNDFEKAVNGYTGQLPEDTAEICAREGDHPSDKDSRDHFTGVCFDSKGVGKTVRFPTKQEGKIDAMS